MAEENPSPISAAVPPVANPAAAGNSTHAATLKLKPVIRKPVIGGARPSPVLPKKPQVPAAPAVAPKAETATPASSSMEQLKSMTQKLKGVTQPIPQQAILHKTGILAEQNFTEAQKQAAKSRTARISLSDALGAAPVQSEAAPMKTIRIKRPSDIGTQPAASAPVPAAPAAAAPTPAAAKPEEPAAPKQEDVNLTQRKTLKITRPGAVRPTGKFSPKKPAADAAEPQNADAPVAEIADIPDIPAKPAKVVEFASPDESDVPQGLVVLDTILQFAACVAIAFLGVFLYLDLNTLWF